MFLRRNVGEETANGRIVRVNVPESKDTGSKVLAVPTASLTQFVLETRLREMPSSGAPHQESSPVEVISQVGKGWRCRCWR